MIQCREQEEPPITLPAQLLVEGKDQKNFFTALAKFLQIDAAVQIRDFRGIQQLRGYLLPFKDQRGFDEIVKRIGIIRDAEADFDAAFSSVCSSLKNAKLPVPKSHGIFTNSSPSVGAMILPGGNQSGMLETLLCSTISDSETNRCIDKFFNCIKNEVGINVMRMEKARARVFLATKPEPHVSVGVAAQKGYWDMNHGQFSGVRGFLRELVNLNSGQV